MLISTTPGRHKTYLCAALINLMVCCSTQVMAQQADSWELNISARPILSALTSLTATTGVQIINISGDNLQQPAVALSGRYTLEQAITSLLADSGLQWQWVDARTISITKNATQSNAIMLGPVKVEATSLQQNDQRRSVYETPASVAVITREDIDRLPPRNTADVLTGAAGVFTSQSRQNPGVSVNIRGMQDFGRVTVMIDGARQNFQKSGHGSNGVVYVDPELLSGVEVFKGPVSTAGGAGSLAGTVNFRTLSADDFLKDGKDSGGRVNLNSGDNQYYFAGSAAGAVKLTEQLSLTAGISRKKLGSFERGSHNAPDNTPEHLHGISQFTGQEQWSGLVKAEWQQPSGHKYQLSYIGLRTDFNESLQETNIADQVRGNNRANMDTVRLGYQYASDDNLWLDVDASLYYTSTRVREQRMNAQYYSDFDVEYATNTLGGSLNNTSLFVWEDTVLGVQYGTEFYYDWTSPKAQSESASDTADKWFTGATPEGKRLVSGWFTEAKLQYKNWLELIGGLRYDWYRLEGDGRMFSGTIINPPGVRPPQTAIYTQFNVERHAGHFVPKLTLSLTPWQWLNAYMSYGEGLRPPAITETLLWGAHVGNMFFYFPNPDLREELSRNTELGFNFNWQELLTSSDTLSLKTAWFDTKVDNYMVQAAIMTPVDQAQPVGFSGFSFVNLTDDVQFRGLELQADYESRLLFASLSYTRMLMEMGQGTYDPFPLGSLYGYPQTSFGQPGSGGVWYVLPPDRRLVASAGVRLFEQKLTIGARYRHEKPAKNPDGYGWVSDSSLDQWQSWDLWLSYEWSKAVTFRLSANNLRDTFYTEMNGGSYQVSPGRTFIGGVSINF